GNHKKAVAMGGAYSDKGLSISKIDNGFILSGKSKSFDDFGEYKPYLSFINIEALSACLIDISDQITQTDVTMSIYEGIYSQSIFPNLEIGNFNSITHDMPATTVCWECPTGSLDTINICYNEPYTINYENSNATSFFWNNNSTESSLTVAQPGHYWVDLLVGACTVRDSIVIRVTPEIPDIEIEEEIVLCNGDSTLIELPYDNTFQYEWNDGSYQHRRFIQGAGTYSGKIESVCETKTFEVSVKIYDPISFIPNAFSPNNDPYNQYFVIDGIVDKVSLHILDRNGRTVFESTDYRNNWDAEGVESGTYFYIVQDQCRNESIKGWLQIIK
ncbi:MAG: gliding motility-associated C-terminal domain-containing protein, partial [bacterium]|nr:gliding motility-associated C-terminal domain-containing protein [bacterium]